ncbi:hypothetical protein [Cupriavidus sp. D384]|uniref:hypothetical protein n=1 Tax=Cupriavidus sp. D384 TaxID=1538095 RepID=UPI0012E991F1|nr:hypothetical protein [Cupriavidus sp. D384]
MTPWKGDWRLQDHAMRIFCAVSCSLLIIVAYSGYERVLALRRNFDIFLYAGTVATLVGLIIAVCEVLNGLRVSKSIQHEARSVLSQANRVDTAAGIGHCVSALNEVISYVNQNDYRFAWRCFVFFRKTYVRIFSKAAGDGNPDGLNILGQIEEVFAYALNRGVPGHLSRVQKNELLKKLLQVKQEVEASNPGGGKIDVAL